MKDDTRQVGRHGFVGTSANIGFHRREFVALVRTWTAGALKGDPSIRGGVEGGAAGRLKQVSLAVTRGCAAGKQFLRSCRFDGAGRASRGESLGKRAGTRDCESFHNRRGRLNCAEFIFPRGGCHLPHPSATGTLKQCVAIAEKLPIKGIVGNIQAKSSADDVALWIVDACCWR